MADVIGPEATVHWSGFRTSHDWKAYSKLEQGSSSEQIHEYKSIPNKHIGYTNLDGDLIHIGIPRKWISDSYGYARWQFSDTDMNEEDWNRIVESFRFYDCLHF